MDDIDAILSDWTDNDTQMDPTNGRESPVIAQTQKTIDRESQRSKSRGVNTRRKRGAAEKRGLNPSSSQSVSPERPPSRTSRDVGRGAAANSGRNPSS